MKGRIVKEKDIWKVDAFYALEQEKEEEEQQACQPNCLASY